MGFYLYTGNDLEKLAKDILCKDILSVPLSDPFLKEKIIVQSRGMAAWLKHQIANNMKICANIEFPFLNNFISAVLENSLEYSQKPTSKHFFPEILTWKIYSILETEISEFPELYTYLLGTNKELKQFQLSEKIAETLDQYLIYRPEMVLNWENSVVLDNDNQWQAKLWQKLSANLVSPSKAFHNFFQTENLSGLPERIILFGISYMPLLFLDFFKHLGTKTNTEVHFFYLNPCREDWYYNLTDKQIDKYLSRSSSLKALTPEDIYAAEGNKLLINYGQAGREFFGAVLNVTEGNFLDSFTDIGTKNLLNSIQSSILDNDIKPSEKYFYTENDISIKIHNCHSKNREVEILYDNILNYIESNPAIQPRDIFVMAPDISMYAPTIKAVFNQKNKELNPDEQVLPYSLSDVNIAMNSKIIKSFFDILNLNYSKFKITEILDILETKAVHESFEIEDVELDTLRKWIIESGMRWGIDASHRKILGLPAFNENSISFAFDRMFLGYALEDDGTSYDNRIIPYDEIETPNSLLLGKFSYFMESLTEVKRLIEKPDSLENWIEKLHIILNKFFNDNNETYKEIVRIRKIFDGLKEILNNFQFKSKISFDILKYYLSQKAGNDKIFEGFLRGKITFCTMQPMRTVPAKIICLLGMNEGAFPREERKAGFNVLDKNIIFCDKSKTLEDRYIFLESLLAAKDAFYISYIGSDNKTNEKSQPSIVVSELSDYIKFNYPEINKNNYFLSESLHGFNEIYHNNSDNKFFSYSKSNLAAAETLRQNSTNNLFYKYKLKNTELNKEVLTLSTLTDFYKNPCKYFITKSLGAKYIINDSDIIEDTEPIKTNALDKYQINKQLIQARIEYKSTELIYERMVKECSLPIGVLGKIKFLELDKIIQEQYEKTIKAFNNARMKELLENTEQINFEIKINSTIISCEMDFVRLGFHHVYFDPGSLNGKKIIECQIKHLALNCKFPYTTYCLIGSKPILFEALSIESAKEKLSSLLNIYFKGLTESIPFLPKTSFAYASDIKDKLSAAKNSFTSTDYNTGEDNDFYIKLCFDNSIFEGELFEEFQKLSKTVFYNFWVEESENKSDQ